MTKYKKLTRSSFVIVALCLALVGILAFGGTYAYFSAQSAEITGTITAKTLTLDTKAALSITADGKIVPNQTVNYNFAEEDVTLGGDTISVMRIKLSTVTLTPAAGKTGVTLDATKVTFTLDTIEGKTWTQDGETGTYYYIGLVNPAEVTSVSSLLKGVKIGLDKSANNDYQGCTISYGITFEVIQAEYVGSQGATPKADSLDAVKAIFTDFAA